MALRSKVNDSLSSRWTFPPLREWLRLGLLALPLFVTFSTIEDIEWVPGFVSLLLQGAIALVLGLLLVQFRFPWAINLAVALPTGLGVGIGLGFWQLSGTSALGVGIFLIVTSWWTAHLTLWLAKRGSYSILTVLPGLLVLLVVLGFAPSRYFIRIPLYLLAAAPALTYFHFESLAGERNWSPRLSILGLGTMLMVAVVAGAWFIPAPGDPVSSTATIWIEDSWYGLSEQTAGLFAGVPSRRDVPRLKMLSMLPFTGLMPPGDDAIMLVKSDQPHKWRVAIYEVYTSRGWAKNPERMVIEPFDQLGLVESIHRDQIEIEVRSLAKTGVMASVGEPIAVGNSNLIETSPTPRFSLDLEGAQTTFLPPDVARVRQVLFRATDPEAENLRSELLETKGLLLEEGQSIDADSITVQRTEEAPGPTLGLWFVENRAPPRSYSTIGSISTATPEMLRAAGQHYPTWVTDRYLQLPIDFPESVSGLAQQLAGGRDNAYDIIESIGEYLDGLPYSTTILAPPPGRDGVEWFLTVDSVGFCQYYASTMITMLRSLGIPARLVVGFTPGVWDGKREAWEVQAKHYHAWPEVYFPGHGWVEFEATPANVQPNLRELGIERKPIRRGDTPDTQGDCPPGRIADPAGPPGACEDDLSGQGGSGGLTAGRDADDAASGDPSVWPRITIVSTVATLAVLGLIIYVRRMASRLGHAAITFASMRFMARLGGIRRYPQDTPEEFGARLTLSIPNRFGPVNEVVGAYVISRYSRTKSLDGEQLSRLRDSWRQLRWPLFGLFLRRLWPRWL